jgi:hypothetical protein
MTKHDMWATGAHEVSHQGNKLKFAKKEHSLQVCTLCMVGTYTERDACTMHGVD